MTPTARSLEALRAAGWHPWVVEQTIRGKRAGGAVIAFKRDLYNAFDIIAIRGHETLAVQVTTLSNMGARVRKLAENEFVPRCRDAGWILEIHGWRKLKTGWQCKVEDVS